jgi:hypothetical protein
MEKSNNWQAMVEMPIEADPIDRNIARLSLRRLQQIPKNRDIRRHHVRCLVDDNALLLGIPTKAPPRSLLIFGQSSPDYGSYFALMLITKDNKAFHAFYDGPLEPGFRMFTVHTALLELAGGYEIKPANRTPYDAEVAHLNEFETRVPDHEKLHIFDLSELREIYALSQNNKLKLTAHDHLQAGFANASAEYFGQLAYSARGGDAPITEQDCEEVRRYSPAMADLLSASSRHDFARGFVDLETAEIERFAGAYMLNNGKRTIPPNLESLLTLFFVCAFRHPRVTAFGLLLPYIGPNVRTIAIAADQLAEDSKTSIELAKCYWSAVALVPFVQDIWNPSILSPHDIFLSEEAFSTQIEPFMARLHGTKEEWQLLTEQLIEESQSLKQWTIPWGAHVEIDYLGFNAVQLFEEGKFVNCLWRTPGGRTAWSDAIIDTPRFTYWQKFPKRVETHWSMFVAALIRDFWVAEERRKLFGVTVRRVRSGKPNKRDARVIYLPRVRYDRPLTPLVHSLNETREGRARHFVRPFFRKVNPTPVQAECARLNDIVVPEGHTYVRGHFRGGAEAAAVYRSRSSMQLLYQTVAPTASDPELETDWFRFELLVRTLLQRQEFEIVRTSTRGKADDGIDVIAVQRIGQASQTWLVQAKCYGPRKNVGPDVVREMIGSLADFRLRYPDEAPIGMIVTTSQFSGEAQRLALGHGIKLVDGTNLKAIATSENARE